MQKCVTWKSRKFCTERKCSNISYDLVDTHVRAVFVIVGKDMEMLKQCSQLAITVHLLTRLTNHTPC